MTGRCPRLDQSWHWGGLSSLSRPPCEGSATAWQPPVCRETKTRPASSYASRARLSKRLTRCPGSRAQAPPVLITRLQLSGAHSRSCGRHGAGPAGRSSTRSVWQPGMALMTSCAPCAREEISRELRLHHIQASACTCCKVACIVRSGARTPSGHATSHAVQRASLMLAAAVCWRSRYARTQGACSPGWCGGSSRRAARCQTALASVTEVCRLRQLAESAARPLRGSWSSTSSAASAWSLKSCRRVAGAICRREHKVREERCLIAQSSTRAWHLALSECVDQAASACVAARLLCTAAQ